jgi:Abnormal spindle-like microcephaly-assoc'd, ASPM-SPD-2-Hydin
MRDKLWVCIAVLFLFTAITVTASPAVAHLTATPASASFGSVNVNSSSASAVIVITNDSERATTIESVSSSLAQFVVTGPSLPLTLQSQQTATFQVVFKPTAASALSANITFTYTRRYGETFVVPVTGTGVPLPVSTYLLSASSTSLSFGSVSMGSSSSQSVSISNTGNSSVTISQISLSGTGFSDTGVTLPVAIAAGQSITVPITFAPTAAGASSGSMTVVSNATNSPMTISLSASGMQPQIAVVPSSVSFGNVTEGVTNTQTVTLSNPGSANLIVSQASLSGSGFTETGIALPLTIAPGGSSSFTISFDPSSAGTIAGTLLLTSNASTPSLSVMVSGTGVAQTRLLSSSTTSLSFGSLTLQTSASQPVTLTNAGNYAVTISQLTVAGPGFSSSGLSLPITLAVGQSTSFNTIFDPTTAGNLAGTVTIVSTATNSPLTIALSGTGAAPVSYSVSLSWQASTSSVAGYNVYVASQSGGPYTRVNSSPVISTSYSDTNVLAGDTYYFVTTAVDSAGDESAYSNQVSALLP